MIIFKNAASLALTTSLICILSGSSFLYGFPTESFEVYDSSISIPQSSIKAEAIKEANKFQPFYIYTDAASRKNHFYSSGWMGDTHNMKISAVYTDNPMSGETCLRIQYLKNHKQGWGGIYWQNPPNNWGETEGGYDLRGAKSLTFWARGERGGERITEFKMGGLTGKFADSDVAWIGPIKLKKKWTQYTIDLRNKDLRYISGGFCFTLLKNENPRGCTFYLDELRYE